MLTVQTALVHLFWLPPTAPKCVKLTHARQFPREKRKRAGGAVRTHALFFYGDVGGRQNQGGCFRPAVTNPSDGPLLQAGLYIRTHALLLCSAVGNEHGLRTYFLDWVCTTPGGFAN